MSCVKQPVYIVDIIGECVSKIVISGIAVKYTYGRQVQILEELQRVNNNSKLKYPLIALYQDFPENRGGRTGYYAEVIIPRIVISCLTVSTDPVPKRYEQTFKPILYPIYYEFLNQISKHGGITQMEVDSIKHIKWDRPGTQPAGTGQNEYTDSIEIKNLTLTIIQNISNGN